MYIRARLIILISLLSNSPYNSNSSSQDYQDTYTVNSKSGMKSRYYAAPLFDDISASTSQHSKDRACDFGMSEREEVNNAGINLIFDTCNHSKHIEELNELLY